MERNVPSLLLIHLVFFVLSAPPCAESTVSNISKVVLISDSKDWLSAQNHCREFHGDLVTITNLQEATELFPLSLLVLVGEPDPNEHCVWKSHSHLKWANYPCKELHPFICDKRVDLVQEKKTWEGALEHCREKENYDLVSLPEVAARNTFLLNRGTITQQATNNEVWIGLRFLAGEWWWMNGERATSSDLPHCPAQQQHCGALLPNEKGWKIMNCSEKRNFICGKNK
ncbi:secretory phospholipase A2 receptor-like [Sebastes umbrosus]|uniref:secretory phospholipase A2 receptor-like n=1 Tax=Sebastes umbrosus TaxID=72105 RepID=UPI00189DA1E2|nr:secretory phospholipase A2 receptor-like [Sebastes umbrosus]